MAVRPETHERLWLAAAVASGWPVLRHVGDEAAVEAALARAEAALGPLPQAVIDEPWEPGGAFGLEIALPGLDAAGALALSASLPGCWFTPGPRPELAEALEQGVRVDESVGLGPVVATRPMGTEGGVRPELQLKGRVDGPVQALEAELVEVLRRVDPSVRTVSDRGPDTVAPAVDPESGRFGVLVSIPGTAFDTLDGEQLVGRRRAVLEALRDVVVDRAEHDTLRLAPDLLWWTALDGMDVVLWIVAPALPVWVPEVDQPVLPGPEERARLAAGELALRVVVVPASPGEFEALCEAGAAVAERVGAGGGPSEWVKRGGRWCLAPTWSIDEPATLEAVVEGFGALGPLMVFES